MGGREGWGWRGAVDLGQERSWGGGGFQLRKAAVWGSGGKALPTLRPTSTNVACVRRRKVCRARIKEEEGTQEKQLQIKNKQKKRTPYAATWMNLEMVVISEVNHKKTNIIYHLYADSKEMIQMNLFTKQRQIHRHRIQTYSYQRGREEGIN